MTPRRAAIVRALWSLRRERGADDAMPTEPAVPYRSLSSRGIAPLADLYLPAGATGASVVLVHGGAFLIGSRRMKPMRYLATRMVAAGIAVCVVDYRLIFRGGRLEEATADVCDAIDFWSAQAARRGLDPGAISLVGLSAGASLALLAAARRPAAVARLACCFGMYEMDVEGPVVGLLPRLLFGTGDRAVRRVRSPRSAPQPTAPTLLLHGDDEGLVPVDQARRLAAHREALGYPTKLVIYPGAPHAFFNTPSSAAEAGVRELVDHVTVMSRRTGSHA